MDRQPSDCQKALHRTNYFIKSGDMCVGFDFSIAYAKERSYL